MENINNIPKEKFRFADPDRRMADKKLDTKQMSYAKDVFRRFCKNKSSVVAAIIILLLVLFAIFVPMLANTTYANSLTDTKIMTFKNMLPRCELFLGTGFWDGTKVEDVNENRYNMLRALEKELGQTVIYDVLDEFETTTISQGQEIKVKKYKIRYDTYLDKGMLILTLDSEQEFKDILEFQNREGVQVLYPMVNRSLSIKSFGKEQTLIKGPALKNDNVWYETDSQGNPLKDKETGELVLNPCYATNEQEDYMGAGYYAPYYVYDSLRIEGDPAKDSELGQDTPGAYIYANVIPKWLPGSDPKGDPDYCQYQVRVSLVDYFHYRYGEEASFLFGTDGNGQDILTRLASGARFSLILAICISAINLFIGAIYGAIEGFYGGAIDLVMERISDVLGGMPSMVVMSLFQLHLASKVGPVWSMVFAFVLTGWLGMAARTRMQFYRFKRQEYVLSARTLGASDARLMFKHIFPNAMGTLITGSILMIPGVIFSESSLTYLGIVNLEGSTQTSVGTLLSNGSGSLSTFPHIIFWPALFISLLEISFNLFGNGLRDAFNPSLKGVDD